MFVNIIITEFNIVIFLNSTQISDAIKNCVLVSHTKLIIYTQGDNFKHGTAHFPPIFHLLLIVCCVMDMHPPNLLHVAVIPNLKNIKLNLSGSSNYRAIALSSIIFLMDTIIISLQSDYLITSALQFGFKEHSSTIMCSTVLVETVEYYISNNSTVYGLLIDAPKAFDRLCHDKLFELLKF